MARLLTTQPPFTVLVANLRGAGDLEHGINPTKIRTAFSRQVFSEISRTDAQSRVQDPRTPGVASRQGLSSWTVAGVPEPAEASITVADADFTAKATILLGGYTVTSTDDYDVDTGTAYVGEDITNTAPDGIIVIWKTAGAAPGEGTIDVPANIPIEPGTVTLTWTSGAASKTQTANSLGVFAGDGNPAGSTINHTTGAITLDTTGDIPDAATAILIDYTAVVTTTNIAAALAAAIDGLPGFTASAALAVVAIDSLAGMDGNNILCTATYQGTVQNFTITNPASVIGYLSGAEPIVGPPDII